MEENILDSELKEEDKDNSIRPQDLDEYICGKPCLNPFSI